MDKDKPIYTKEEVLKLLTEKEQEWRYEFLKNFQANLTISTESFERLLTEYIRAYNSFAGRLPSITDLQAFVFTFFNEEERKKRPDYDKIYMLKLETLGLARREVTMEAYTPQPAESIVKAEPTSSTSSINEIILRPFAPFNTVETEIMTAVLKKFYIEQITAQIQKLKPDLVTAIRNNKLIYDFRPLFSLLTRISNRDWVSGELFFQHAWQDFVEMAKKMYLSVKKDTKITNIRPGQVVKNFTRAGFYGMLLTIDYCSTELKNPKLSEIFNCCMRYFTLAFEKDPDAVLEDVQFFSQPALQEILAILLGKIIEKASPSAAAIRTEMEGHLLFMIILNSPMDKIPGLITLLHKIYYISLVHHFCAMTKGQKTAVGYSNERNELLTFDHPQVQAQFSALTTENDWKIEADLTNLAMHVNIFKNQTTDILLIPNFLRAVIESVKAEIPLVNSTSLIVGKNIKQGMERELSEIKYFKPVITFLMENRETVSRILKQYKGR